MALVKPDTARIAKIRVIGIGGGGGNAVSSMIDGDQIKGVEFIAVNTDNQVLFTNKAPTKLQIGEKLTRGLGVGGDPELGKQAAEESIDKIKEFLVDSDMVFITAGFGGGTGTGAAPIIAKAAKDAGALTVAIVTRPFAFEGTRRTVVADEGIERLRESVDTLIDISNQRLMDVIDRKMTLREAFKVADSVLAQGVAGVADIITTPGLINVDFADVKTIMKDAGTAILGIGTGIGENRAQMAARAAMSFPLLDISVEGAKGMLFNIAGGEDMTMFEVDDAARIISGAADADANVIFGAVINEKLTDQIRITIVATGFDEARLHLGQMPKPPGRPITSVSQLTSPQVSAPGDQDEEEELKLPTEEPEKSEIEEEGPDEFGSKFEIPAFLRQNRN